MQIPKLENTNYIEKKTLINERDFIRMVLIIFAKMDGQPASTNSFLILKKIKKESFPKKSTIFSTLHLLKHYWLLLGSWCLNIAVKNFFSFLMYLL